MGTSRAGSSNKVGREEFHPPSSWYLPETASAFSRRSRRSGHLEFRATDQDETDIAFGQ
jgi:hypothetical protein